MVLWIAGVQENLKNLMFKWSLNSPESDARCIRVMFCRRRVSRMGQIIES